MTMKGGIPKPDDERQRRNVPGFERTIISWDGIRRGPNLDRAIDWSKETKTWWNAWRNSPQAMLFVDTDWETLKETALVHNAIYSERKKVVDGQLLVVPLTVSELTSLLGELRRRTAAFGATIEDRMKLRMTIDQPSNEDKVLKAAEEVVDYASQLKDYLENN